MSFPAKLRVLLLGLLLGSLLGATTPNIETPTLNNKSLAESLRIEADNINYLDKNEYVQASGNVLIVFKDIRVTANVTTFNVNSEIVAISEGFVLNRSNQSIQGDSLYYDFQKKEGTATSANMRLMNKSIRGKDVTIKNDSIVINNAQQTTCPALEKCNLIISKRMAIYPEWGDIVHDHAVVYFFFIPIMYVPNYVSDVNGNSDLMYSAIPKFGSNPIEGNYAKVGISYYQNEKLNGALDLHYLSKLGFRGGFTNNYKLNQANRGQVRVHYLTGLGGRLSYGWQHRILLGIPYKERQEIIDDFFRGIMPPSKTDYPEFVIDITSREMSGYQWISYKPKLSLYSPAYEIFNTAFFYKLSAYIANIYEEDIQYLPGLEFQSGNREYRQTSWDFDLYRPFDLKEWGRLTPGTFYKKAGYYTPDELVGAWKQFYHYANYQKEWWRFEFSAGYKYTVAESGYSLFNSESYYAGTSEENSFGLNYQILDNLKLGYRQVYSITEKKVRDKEYLGIFKLCCWNVRFGWSAYLSQFTLGITLD